MTPFKRGTSISRTQVESALVRGAGISAVEVEAEVSRITEGYGDIWPPSNVLTLAVENLLKAKVDALESQVKMGNSIHNPAPNGASPAEKSH